MNIPCEVIQDLLPLYQDGVCSKESQQIVEEHLLHCVACSQIWKEMDRPLEVKEKLEEMDEVETLKKLSKKWNKEMMISMAKGAVYTLVMVFLALLILYIFVDIKIA